MAQVISYGGIDEGNSNTSRRVEPCDLVDLNDCISSSTICTSARPSIQNVNIAERQISVSAVKQRTGDTTINE